MDDQERRDAAIKRLKAKRGFQQNIVAYVAVNALLVIIWFTGGRGFFWPIFVMAGWGVGLALHGWQTYGAKPITEDEVRREMERGGGDAVG